MSKALRHQRILDLVRSQRVLNQEQLRLLLERDGFKVTQSTLSRDIKDLSLVKGREGYQIPAPTTIHPLQSRTLRNAVQLYMRRCTPAQNVLVLRTAAGHAHPLALAVDHAELEGVLGTLAGDDTVLLITLDNSHAEEIAQKLLALAEG